MSAPELASLREGSQAELVCLLAKKQIAQTKAGKPYGNLTLADASGQVAAKLWDGAEELLAGLEPGQPVRITGRVESYQGRTQVVVNSIAAEPGADPAEFLPKSPVPVSDLWRRLTELMLGVRHRRLKRLLRAFFEDQAFHADFSRAPAAKGAHHAYVHGLLEHTVSVGEMAEKTADHYPGLGRDLLVAGALLHDVGKVAELTLGPPIDYTDQGRLEGHLVLGVRMLDARLAGMKGFPEPLAGHLRHLLLSHHGSYEFGSPRRPKTPEAMALHLLDDLDAKLVMMRDIAGGAEEGRSWSDYHRLLERFIYTGPSPLEPPASAAPAAEEPAAPAAESLELFGK
jgi:3'-5' exoribonuclease